MSRIGKLPIAIKSGVTISFNDNVIVVKGPKGQLSYTVPNGVNLNIQENHIDVTIISDEFKNMWGLVRTLISNMVDGVTDGYQKKLLVFGVGYNVKSQGTNLILSLGLSHTVTFALPAGITSTLEKDPKGSDIITIMGIDKQQVGEVAAKIRSLRIPEIYKGKGIRYIDEVIKLKAGKTAKK